MNNFFFFFKYKYVPNISWDILIPKRSLIVYLKFTFNPASVLLFAKSGNPGHEVVVNVCDIFLPLLIRYFSHPQLEPQLVMDFYFLKYEILRSPKMLSALGSGQSLPSVLCNCSLISPESWGSIHPTRRVAPILPVGFHSMKPL